MARIVLILIGVAVVAIAAFQLNKRQIAERAFDKALDARIASRLNPNREDGIHVFVCGAGAPMPTMNAGPCTAVIAGDRAFIFDTGSGSPRKLGLTSFPMDTVDGIFLTHLHSDHIDSLGEMLLLAWIGGSREAPLPVYGLLLIALIVGFVSSIMVKRSPIRQGMAAHQLRLRLVLFMMKAASRLQQWLFPMSRLSPHLGIA